MVQNVLRLECKISLFSSNSILLLKSILLYSNILKKQGSAVDAAIATLFCEGVTCPQSMGLGGGFVATIYSKSIGKVESLTARETAPKAATEDMYVNKNVTGALAIAVPGELKGYWEMHKKYGKLPWAALVDPTIELCRRGHIVTGYLARILERSNQLITTTPSLAEVFVNPATGHVWRENDLIKRIALAETLEIIANEGVDTLYNNGTIAQKLIPEIQSLDGILTIEDLMEYKVRWEEPEVSTIIHNYKMYTNPLPATGLLITFMLNVLTGYEPSVPSVTSLHRIAETFKFAYAERTELGDASFVDGMTEVIFHSMYEYSVLILTFAESSKNQRFRICRIGAAENKRRTNRIRLQVLRCPICNRRRSWYGSYKRDRTEW